MTDLRQGKHHDARLVRLLEGSPARCGAVRNCATDEVTRLPTSDYNNISAVLSVIASVQPASVLDVGCGFGKYGVLLREYLDIWNERLTPDTWHTRLVGVEAFEDYRNPISDYVYNELHFGPAQQVLPALGRFDLVLISDVIEHLEIQDATRLVEHCLNAGSIVLISTPRDFYRQHDICGNPYEVHRCHWKAQHFPNGAYVSVVHLLSCNLFVASLSPLPDGICYLADYRNVLYIQSRYRLRRLRALGLPISYLLRQLARLFA